MINEIRLHLQICQINVSQAVTGIVVKKKKNHHNNNILYIYAENEGKICKKKKKKRYLSNHFANALNSKCESWRWKGFCNHAQNSVISDIKDVDF